MPNAIAPPAIPAVVCNLPSFLHLQPTISSISGSPIITAPAAVVRISFGGRVLGADPAALFTVTADPPAAGFARASVIYQVSQPIALDGQYAAFVAGFG